MPPFKRTSEPADLSVVPTVKVPDLITFIGMGRSEFTCVRAADISGVDNHAEAAEQRNIARGSRPPGLGTRIHLSNGTTLTMEWLTVGRVTSALQQWYGMERFAREFWENQPTEIGPVSFLRRSHIVAWSVSQDGRFVHLAGGQSLGANGNLDSITASMGVSVPAVVAEPELVEYPRGVGRARPVGFRHNEPLSNALR